MTKTTKKTAKKSTTSKVKKVVDAADISVEKAEEQIEDAVEHAEEKVKEVMENAKKDAKSTLDYVKHHWKEWGQAILGLIALIWGAYLIIDVAVGVLLNGVGIFFVSEAMKQKRKERE